MISNKEHYSSLTPKIKQSYYDFELITQTSYYKLYDAKSIATKQSFTVWALDTNSQFVRRDRNMAFTRFIQEILRLCTKLQNVDAIMIEDFEIYESGMAFVLKQTCHSLQKFLFEPTELKTKINIETLVKDLVSDVNFLYKQMKLCEPELDLKNIYWMKEANLFMIGDWAAAKVMSPEALETVDLTSMVTVVPGIQTLRTVAKEAFIIGLVALELGGVRRKLWKSLLDFKDSELYDGELGNILSRTGWSKQNDSTQKLLKQLLNKDITHLIQPEQLFKSLEGVATIKLAWCSWVSNLISVYNIQSSKNIFADVKGAALKAGGSSTYVEQVPGTTYLISLNQYYEKAANFEVFDTGKNMQKVFGLGEVQGVVGLGDISCNARRKTAALISIRDTVSYYLFDTEALEVVRKSKWQTTHKHIIDSMSFDAGGERIATIDWKGIILLSQVETDSYSFHYQLMQGGGSVYGNRCRWNPNADFPLVAVKYDSNSLNMLDIEKQSLIHKESFKPDVKSTMWIEWHNDGNLLACGGYDKSLRIYDVRVGKIVKNIENVHNAAICCLKWNSNGNMIATASWDGKIRVTDFNNPGRVVYFGETNDQKPAYSVCFIESPFGFQ